MYQQSQQLAALEERARLARDLHDSVTQTLFSANVMAESALRRWEKDLSQSYDYLKEVHQLTGSALAEMRVLLMELRPASLSQVKFDQLLQLLVQSLQSRKQLDLSLEIESLPELPAEAKISLYRVVQEAVNNILKHSLATRAAINVEEHGEDLILQIQDNGKGFEPSKVEPPSLGLNFMQERMTKIGASLTIDSAPGKGTLIRVVWPTALGKELDRE
jgi:signal transduction histidine kinase